MHLDWKSLYYGKVTKEALREMTKGQPLETTAYQRKKFENLDSMTAHELRLTNYVTALSRGGLTEERGRDNV